MLRLYNELIIILIQLVKIMTDQ